MSHPKERIDKDCLNCGTTVEGRYCQKCGQENIEPRQTFGFLISHFVADVFHFDGKFFSTLKYLFTRPGFLSKEYIAGRRQKYLHPIKMFIFTSAIFFLLYFSLLSKEEKLTTSEYKDLATTTVVQSLGDTLSQLKDSTQKIGVSNAINELKKLYPLKEKNNKVNVGFNVGNNVNLPTTLKEYDSIQLTLPEKDRDNYLEKMLLKKNLKNKEGGRLSETMFSEDFKHHLIKTIPQILFICLPLFALFYKLLYVRRKHTWLYVDHIIFLVHLFTAIYIIMLLKFGFEEIFRSTSYRIFNWISILILVFAFIYPVIAMYRFYGQGILKTIGKYIIILILGLIGVSILITITAFFTLLTV